MATDADDQPLQWNWSWIECVICGCVRVVVYPTTAPRLECVQCGYMNEKPDPPDQAAREDVNLTEENYL